MVHVTLEIKIDLPLRNRYAEGYLVAKDFAKDLENYLQEDYDGVSVTVIDTSKGYVEQDTLED